MPGRTSPVSRLKTLRMCWELDGSATDRHLMRAAASQPWRPGVLFLASRGGAHPVIVMSAGAGAGLALLGRNWMHRTPGTGDVQPVQPVQILSPGHGILD